MPLTCFDYGPGERPAIICDACGKEINTAEEGNYHWAADAEGAAKPVVYFSHKSNCARLVDEKFKTPSCMGLDHLLLCLVNNLKWNRRAAEGTQDLMDRIRP